MDINDARNSHKKAFRKASQQQNHSATNEILWCCCKTNGPVSQNHVVYGAAHFMVNTAASVELPVLTAPCDSRSTVLAIFFTVMGSVVSNGGAKLRFLLPAR